MRRYERGTNLIELLTTIGVFSLSAALGVPSYQTLSSSVQRNAVVTEMTGCLRFARSEAGRRGSPVSLCPSADGATCTARVADNAPEWSTGWITFLDPNGNGTPDQGETLLNVYRVENPSFHLRGDAALAAGVTFGETGFPLAAGSLNYCDARTSRTLTLSFVGGLRDSPADGGCL